MEHAIYKDKFSIRRILKESWLKYKENYKPIFLITLIVYIPINIIINLINTGDDIKSMLSYLRLYSIFEGLFGILAIMTIYYIVKKGFDNEKVSFGEAIKKAVSRWIAMIGTNILFGIFIFGLALLLIVPAIIYYTYWIFTIYAVIIKNQTGKKALAYSKTMVQSRWWTVLGYSIALTIITLLIGFIAGVPYVLLPDTILTSIIYDCVIDLILAYTVIVGAVFAINFDSTKLPNKLTKEEIDKKEIKKQEEGKNIMNKTI